MFKKLLGLFILVLFTLLSIDGNTKSKRGSVPKKYAKKSYKFKNYRGKRAKHYYHSKKRKGRYRYSGFGFPKNKVNPYAPEYLALNLPVDSGFIAYYSKSLKVDSFSNAKLIANAASWLGCPYVYGGCTKRGTDCSGFVSSLYKDVFNIHLTHGGASMLSQMNKIIKKGEQMKEGDILFFRHGKHISHVAIYLRNHKFIHAATQGRGVVVDDLRDPYFARTFMVAGRVMLENNPLSANP